MTIRELIKEYRDDIWQEAYCHPFSDSEKSDSVLEKIESELKELEEKAEDFDWLSKQDSIIHQSVISGNTHISIDLEDGLAKVIEGSDLLECVRKARGD